MKNKEALSEAETIVMKAVWDAEKDLTAQELTDFLMTEYGKEYKKATVTTFLMRLMDKGFISMVRDGKSSKVHAVRSEESYKEFLLRRDTDFWYKGKISKLLATFCAGEGISEEEADEIRGLLDGMGDMDQLDH